MPSPKELLMQMLSKGAEMGSSGAVENMKNQASLNQLLAGKQADLSNSNAEFDRAKQEVQEAAGKGKRISAKIGGASYGDSETDPTLAKNRGTSSAIEKANGYYMKGLPKIQEMSKAAQMGLESVNDPKQVGSLGQARTMLLKTFGMNRYNENEANAVLPPAVRGTFAKLFNSAGDDMNPLNESQRAAVNSIFSSTLEHAKTQHEMLKQNALNSYKTSPYYEPERGALLENTMGAPFAKELEGSITKYKPVPTTQPPAPSAAPLPGLLDNAKAKLSQLFGGASPATPASATTGPHGDAVVQDGVTYKWNPAKNTYE